MQLELVNGDRDTAFDESQKTKKNGRRENKKESNLHVCYDGYCYFSPEWVDIEAL